MNRSRVFPARLLGQRAGRRRRPRSCSCGPWATTCGRPWCVPAAACGPGPVSAWTTALEVEILDAPPLGRTAAAACASSPAAGRSPTSSSAWATSPCRPTSTVPIDPTTARATRPSTPASRAAWPRPPRASTSPRPSSTRLATRGIERAEVVLHVGPGTFRPGAGRGRGATTPFPPSPSSCPRRRPVAIAARAGARPPRGRGRDHHHPRPRDARRGDGPGRRPARARPPS